MTAFRTHTIAEKAYQCVDAREREPFKKAYGALAHKLPGLILQNGLAQATGFLLAKGSDKHPEHHALLDDLNQVLRVSGATTADDRKALHKQIIGADLAGTIILTRRSLEIAGWIKRYAQGVLKVDATGETKTNEGG